MSGIKATPAHEFFPAGFSSDLTFITNEPGKSLRDRFGVLLGDDTRLFDCLVGYFFISGFHKLYPALEKVEKVRILVGLKTDSTAYELLQRAKEQGELALKSHAAAKEQVASDVLTELENADDVPEIETGVHKFVEWVRSKKLEIKAHPDQNLHAKVYIMTFAEGDRDKGRVIGELLVAPNAILDDKQRVKFLREVKLPFLAKGTLVYLGISGTALQGGIPPGLIHPHDLKFQCGYLLVEVVLSADLLLRYRGDQKASLEDCECRIPALDKVVDKPPASLNHALTLASIHFEKKRRQHTGNIFNRAWTHVGGRWQRLDELRIATIEAYLAAQQRKAAAAANEL